MKQARRRLGHGGLVKAQDKLARNQAVAFSSHHQAAAALLLSAERNATNQKLDVAELLVRIFWSKPAPGGVRPSALNSAVPGAYVPTQAKSIPRSSRGARAAQTGVPPVNNSSGPHTRIGRYVVNGAYLSPWVLGTPRAAKIRPQTPHIAPADPN